MMVDTSIVFRPTVTKVVHVNLLGPFATVVSVVSVRYYSSSMTGTVGHKVWCKGDLTGARYSTSRGGPQIGRRSIQPPVQCLALAMELSNDGCYGRFLQLLHSFLFEDAVGNKGCGSCSIVRGERLLLFHKSWLE